MQIGNSLTAFACSGTEVMVAARSGLLLLGFDEETMFEPRTKVLDGGQAPRITLFDGLACSRLCPRSPRDAKKFSRRATPKTIGAKISAMLVPDMPD